MQEVKELVEKKVEVEKEIDALYTVLESVCNNNPFTPYGLAFLISCFFQAEDGIRYCLLSRGLGDVYKKQVLYCTAN